MPRWNDYVWQANCRAKNMLNIKSGHTLGRRAVRDDEMLDLDFYIL
jgi:hypothetical protein